MAFGVFFVAVFGAGGIPGRLKVCDIMVLRLNYFQLNAFLTVNTGRYNGASYFTVRIMQVCIRRSKSQDISQMPESVRQGSQFGLPLFTAVPEGHRRLADAQAFPG